MNSLVADSYTLEWYGVCVRYEIEAGKWQWIWSYFPFKIQIHFLPAYFNSYQVPTSVCDVQLDILRDRYAVFGIDDVKNVWGVGELATWLTITKLIS